MPLPGGANGGDIGKYPAVRRKGRPLGAESGEVNGQEREGQCLDSRFLPWFPFWSVPVGSGSLLEHF